MDTTVNIIVLQEKWLAIFIASLIATTKNKMCISWVILDLRDLVKK